MIVAFLCAVAKLTLAPSALTLLLPLGTGWSLGAIGVQSGALDVLPSVIPFENAVNLWFVWIVFLLRSTVDKFVYCVRVSNTQCNV